jgi:hypothetical protein
VSQRRRHRSFAGAAFAAENDQLFHRTSAPLFEAII